MQVQWAVKIRIAHEVIRGMQYLHTRTPSVVHGDLKVQSVLIGDDYIAKVNVVYFFQIHSVCNVLFEIIFELRGLTLWLRCLTREQRV